MTGGKGRCDCLVVEDEALIRRNIAKKIRALGAPFRVTGEAIDGQSALQAITAEPPDIVLTDIKMPGMGGLELAEALHRDYPHIVVIIISGFAEFKYAKQAMKFGVSDYLLKPVSIEELGAILNQALARLGPDPKVLGSIARSRGMEMRPEELADILASYIREHFREQLSLEDIAEQFLISPDYLCKVFKRSEGKPPMKYLAHLRIVEARRLLGADPGLSVKGIGEVVGYPDPNYFSRVFKAHTGLYPSEYRQASMKERGDGEPA